MISLDVAAKGMKAWSFRPFGPQSGKLGVGTDFGTYAANLGWCSVPNKVRQWLHNVSVSRDAAPINLLEKPTLLIVVDTEEELDWSSLSSSADKVTNIRYQARAHKIFDSLKIIPTYLIDYPVATKAEGYGPLRELHQDGLCEIGAQLHPWVNPPLDEVISNFNSFAGNLPPSLEREKLKRLTEEIERQFGIRPLAYRAGRYGLGLNTARFLHEFGYQVDMSVRPRTDLRSMGGPDFSSFGPTPFWFGPDNAILEIPQTAEILGLLAFNGAYYHRLANRKFARGLRVPGLLARLNLLDRITLTPEGVQLI